MEREQTPPHPKLIDIARRDFPQASDVLVSFSSDWEYIDTVERDGQRLYVAGFPIERAHLGRHHFEGLGTEINIALVFYRLYKFFEPWPMPQVTVEWNDRCHQGHVTDVRAGRVQLQPVGQAQAWFGVDHAVLWECYLDSTRRGVNSPENLEQVWNRVEEDVGAPKLFTLPYEPAFEGNYTSYLNSLGFREDTENVGWWSKTRPANRVSVTPSD